MMFTRDNPYQFGVREVYRNIQLNYEKMRRVALAEGFSAVWVVESDTIPPLDALTKLYEIDAPIVTGLYALRHGEPVPNVMRHGDMPEIGGAMEWAEVYKQWGQTIPTSGGCMGCLLIRRPVLEKFSFITERGNAPDVPLMEFCWKNKFEQVARLDVICGHKKPNGEILLPRLGKVELLDRWEWSTTKLRQ